MCYASGFHPQLILTGATVSPSHSLSITCSSKPLFIADVLVFPDLRNPQGMIHHCTSVLRIYLHTNYMIICTARKC
jgi:hypothetical protein